MHRIIFLILLIAITVPALAADPQLYGATQETVTRTRYLRARAIGIANPIGGAPQMDIYRESCVIYSDNRSAECTDAGVLRVGYDPQYVITLRNPQTGATLGQTNFQALYVEFDSLFRQKQAEDEARIIAEAEAKAEAERVAAEKAAAEAAAQIPPVVE
jgi:hypothetical protein